MLENILELVKQYGRQHVVENPSVPNEYNNEVMVQASGAITRSLQSALASGNIAQLMQMFNSDNEQEVMANPVAQQAQEGFIDRVTNKMGINRNTAMTIGAALLPLVISQLVKRTRSNAPQDSGFDLTRLIGSLTGGAGTSNIGNLINQFTGGGGGAQPGFDLDHIIRQVSQGAKERQQDSNIGSLIRNFFN